MTDTDIVVLGSLNMDLVVKVCRAPLAGETIRGQDVQMIPGGKGANQAAAVAKLGGKVAMVGRVGNDAFGPLLINNLARLGVETSHIQIDQDTTTGMAFIVVEDNGENRIIISAGANGRVGKEDVDCTEALFQRAKMLILQLEVPLEAVEYAIERATYYPIKVILNPAPAIHLPSSILEKVHCLVPNETEASLLTGLEVHDLPSAEEAARQLLARGVPEVIITLGEKGALLVTKQEAVHVAARKVQVADTTAAGDAFIGGLAVALVRGFSPREAVRYATCAGTLAVTKFGAQTSLPSAAEVQAFYEGIV